MTVREYIGARYVPLFIGEWDNSVTYEPLSIVQYQGNSYTSRQFVPVNTPITDELYWANTGNYNAQVEAYRQEVQTFNGRISTLERKFPIVSSDITDDAITTGKILDNAVTTGKILDDAITTGKILDDAITTGKILDDAITTGKILDGAITSDKLAMTYPFETASFADDSITSDKIANGAILDIVENSTCFLSPEMFGALGGSNDDTQAFQDMFDAAVPGNVCILLNSEYTIKNTIDIEESFLTFIGFDFSGSTPKINIDNSGSNFTYGFHITGQSLAIKNIHFAMVDHTNTNYGLFYEREDVDATITSCTFSSGYNLIRVKGKNIKIHDCLFSIWQGKAITISDAQVANMRGYWFHDNRFHAGNHCIDTQEVTDYYGIFALSINSNYFDGCNHIYQGITDNVAINNNIFHQHNLDSDYIIEFTKTLSQSSHVTCCVMGNYVSDIAASTRLKGFLRCYSENIHGLMNIANNTFDSQLADDHPVMVIRASSTVNSFITILNNVIRTNNAATPIQVASNYATLNGLINGNYVVDNGSTHISAGSLDVGVNYHN